MRDDKSRILGSFSKSIGLAWAHEAEIIAIKEAFLFCKQYSVGNVLLESDSSLAVGWVNSNRNRPPKLINILNEIDWLRSDGNVISIVHIYRGKEFGSR